MPAAPSGVASAEPGTAAAATTGRRTVDIGVRQAGRRHELVRIARASFRSRRGLVDHHARARAHDSRRYDSGVRVTDAAVAHANGAGESEASKQAAWDQEWAAKAQLADATRLQDAARGAGLDTQTAATAFAGVVSAMLITLVDVAIATLKVCVCVCILALFDSSLARDRATNSCRVPKRQVFEL